MIKIKNSFQITGEVKITKGLSPMLPERIKEKYKDNGFSELLSKSNTILRYGKNALVRKIWGVDVSAELGAVTKLVVGDGFTDFYPWGEPIITPPIDYTVSENEELAHRIFDVILDTSKAVEVDGTGFSKTVYAVLNSMEHSPFYEDNPLLWSANNTNSYISEFGLADVNNKCFAKINCSPIKCATFDNLILTIEWKIKLSTL